MINKKTKVRYNADSSKSGRDACQAEDGNDGAGIESEYYAGKFVGAEK